jgi:trehalose utilization protein
MKIATVMSTFIAASSLSFSAESPVRVLVWDERQEEQKQAYHGKYLGDTIAAHLQQQEGITVQSLGLDSSEQGLSNATLEQTDVLIYWSHKKMQISITPAPMRSCVA